MKDIYFAYLLFVLLGACTTACVLLINKYFNIIYVKYLFYVFVTLFIIGAIFMSLTSIKMEGNEEIIKIDKVNRLDSISINNAFNLMKMSRVVSYEGSFHAGIFREYPVVDIEMIFPVAENNNIDSKVALWCYEHKISHVEKKGNQIYIMGRQGEEGSVYFTFIDSGILNDAGSLFTLASE